MPEQGPVRGDPIAPEFEVVATDDVPVVDRIAPQLTGHREVVWRNAGHRGGMELRELQIGQRLHWSHATVKKYVQGVLEKLDVQDRTRAAVEGVRRGLVD